MAENDQTSTAEAETQRVDYAYWDLSARDGQGEAFRVLYSLQLFHEIDFVVNEGYRKIPHGGIETAGLLLGSISPGEVRIEEFRPIECEHAAGPSLQLSERDLAGIEGQLEELKTDPKLEHLRPVGWFLGHTRGALELSEVEAKQFDRFFSEPSQLTVIVKPERFQPTRFGFLVRKANGEMPRDASAAAVILPLPGRSFKAGEIVASIPAPHPIATVKRTPPPSLAEPVERETARTKPQGDSMPMAVPEEILEARRRRKARAQALQPDASDLASIWKVPPAEELQSDEDVIESGDDADEAKPVEPLSRERRDERRRVARERARRIEEAYPASGDPVSEPVQSGEPAVEPFTPDASSVPEVVVPRAFRPAAMPSLPADALRPLPGYDRFLPDGGMKTEPGRAGHAPTLSGFRSVTALAIAALLGCLVGYLAYLQLPAPVIPIDVRAMEQGILVSWPPEETRGSDFASIRLDDGIPMPLSAQEKKAGQVTLKRTQDFKIEIVAHNWIRDSRGIVHYLHSNVGNSHVVPVTAPDIP